MYCKRCLYNLEGLEENRCPECGRTFDPENRRTLCRSPRRRINWLGWLTIGVSCHPLLLYAMLFAMWVCGRLALGRWPAKYADDPWYIDHGGLELFRFLVGMLLSLIFVAMGATLIGLLASLVWAVVGTHRWRAFMRLVIATLLLWFGGIAILWFEPFELVAWYID